MNSQQRHLGGFSIVEMMVVVAILALLAAFAMPNLLRARKRAVAVMILSDMKAVEGAKITYVASQKMADGDPVPWNGVRDLLKPSLPLAQQDTPKDRFGNAIDLGDAKTTPKLSQATIDELTAVAPAQQQFWAGYAPEP